MKIAILGTAPSSRMLAPFHDTDWQVWATGPANRSALPRIDTWFELHPIDWFEAQPKMAEYLAWMAMQPELYLQKPDDNYDNGIVYPKDAMLAKYGEFFFTSSIAWMLALAIEQQPEEIGLWGVDMAADDEYSGQKSGCHFFIQQARQAGIKVTVPDTSDLLASGGVYGYREASPMYRKLMARRSELAGRIKTAEQTVAAQTREIHVLTGAVQDIDYMLRTWVDQ
jgi:hypothetical protein